MADRAKFSKSLILSDSFMDLSLESKALYFMLGIVARDKGVVINAKATAKMLQINELALKSLVDKGFLLEDDEGHYHIKHWEENNGIGENAKERTTYKYRQFRKRILERDEICQMCGTKKNLEVHHTMPFAQYPELRYDEDNAITLCKKCHMKLHKELRDG